jgi:redox-sensitive bicupin YhaK (pirin superfamily)
MIRIRKADDRGHTKTDWLDSRHTFSFSGYKDPEHMGFRALRVINDDLIAPGGGFSTHPHQDMEIITLVVDGTLGHKDILGSTSVMRPGDVQAMSAGSGLTHSEFNHSQTEPLRIIQIWIKPEDKGLAPRYQERGSVETDKRGRLALIASQGGREGSLPIYQDTNLYIGAVGPDDQIVHRLEPGRHAWIQTVSGEVTLNGLPLAEGDGAEMSEEDELEIETSTGGKILLFDLA